MRDYQEVILKFVKIVEKHPEVYNFSLDTYRTRHTDLAWEQIAAEVRSELGEDCNVDEIKSKWKGIRSSFNRFKNRLESKPELLRKKYYLYDSLKFLEPYIKPKGVFVNAKDRNFEECDNSTISDDEKMREDYNSVLETFEIEIKSEVPEDVLNTADVLSNDTINVDRLEGHIVDILEPSTSDCNKSRKRKCEDSDHEDCEDLQFLKSILPDIRHFTAKEKRRLKMGILQLIDEIDDSRKESNASNKVSSSKYKNES